VEEIRVLVASQPRLMRGAVCAALSCHRDIKVVGDPQGEPEIFAAMCDSALDEHPHMKIRAAALGSEDDTTATAAITDIASGVRPKMHPARAKKLGEKSPPVSCQSRIFLDSIQTAGRQNSVEEHEQAQLSM
jgi:hypothetical protein